MNGIAFCTTSFVPFADGTRAEGDFKLTDVLNPSKGTVVVDVTFHEDNTINGLQAADQYDFSNQGVWNAANSFIFHDTETSPFPSGVHTRFEELKTLPDDLKKKMILYHYDATVKPENKSGEFFDIAEAGSTYEF